MDLRTGFAYWPLRNGLLASYPRLDRDDSADVTIVGAGITGALAAYELTHAGADVVVVDTRDVASGSSAATTGLLLCETDTSLLELSHRVGEAAAARAYHLGLEAIGRIESLTVSLADSCGFARRSSLYLASTSDAARTLEREYALRRRHGIGVASARFGEHPPPVGHSTLRRRFTVTVRKSTAFASRIVCCQLRATVERGSTTGRRSRAWRRTVQRSHCRRRPVTGSGRDGSWRRWAMKRPITSGRRPPG